MENERFRLKMGFYNGRHEKLKKICDKRFDERVLIISLNRQ